MVVPAYPRKRRFTAIAHMVRKSESSTDIIYRGHIFHYGETTLH